MLKFKSIIRSNSRKLKPCKKKTAIEYLSQSREFSSQTGVWIHFILSCMKGIMFYSIFISAVLFFSAEGLISTKVIKIHLHLLFFFVCVLLEIIF